jgi:hypothetical protein
VFRGSTHAAARFFCGRRSALSTASIYIFSMPDSYNNHDYFVVLDLVNDSIAALPYPILFLSRKLLDSRGSRLL